ncbi:MAG: metallophosphoesterase [Sphingomicrobium sp.]
MLKRLWRSVGLVVAAAVAVGPAAALPPPQPARIIAVGDLHGDFAAWRDIAGAAGLVGRNGQWTGGRTTLVQVGDMVDRGPDSLKIIRELMRLQKEAPRQGGRVIVLVGNHEAMNITGDLRYVTRDEFAAFATRRSAELRDRLYDAKKADIEANYRAKDPSMTPSAIRDAWLNATPDGWVEHRLAWAPSGEIGRWVIRNPAAALVNGNLFVHGGISAEYSKLQLADLNRKVAAALKAVEQSPSSIVHDPLGPLWYRGLITRDPKAAEIPPVPEGAAPRPSMEQELATVLSAYGARRIVVGHTPNLAGVQILFGGRLVGIDSGIARYYRGTPSYLEIIGDRLIPRKVERSPAAGGGGK